MVHDLPVPSVRTALRRLLPHLLQAQAENLNEADTVQRLIKVFEEVLGYDPMAEISRESQIKGKFVDVTIKIDGVTRFLVEVKAAGVALRDRHAEQARGYAAQGNVPWVLLTNGTAWILYHLTFEEGIEFDRVFSLELTSDLDDDACALLALLHRDSVRRELHEEFWRRKSALSPENLGRALFTESVLRLLRREIRRVHGIFVDEDSLVSGLKGLFSVEVREQMGPVKVRRYRKRMKATTEETPPTSTPPVGDGDSTPPETA